MKPSDLALALVVVVVWGVNFVVIKAGVGEVPPLLLGALRFLAAALPAVAFLRPPKLPHFIYRPGHQPPDADSLSAGGGDQPRGAAKAGNVRERNGPGRKRSR